MSSGKMEKERGIEKLVLFVLVFLLFVISIYLVKDSASQQVSSSVDHRIRFFDYLGESAPLSIGIFVLAVSVGLRMVKCILKQPCF